MADGPYTLDNLHIDNDLGGSNSSRGTQTYKTPGVLPDTVVTNAKTTSADPLTALKMVNVGSGAGVYKDRIDNTFTFRSLKAGQNVTMVLSDDEILISAEVQGGGPGDPVSFFDLTDAPDPTGQDGKVLGLVAGDLAWVDQQSGGGTGVDQFTELTDAPSSYAGQGGKVVAVKSDASGLEFITPQSGGGGSGNTTRYDATISWDGNSVPTVTDLPAGWTFQNDTEIPGRIIINHTTGKIPYGVSLLAYQDDVAALTPLGTGLYRISMTTATLTTQFMVNIPSLSPVGGSINSTGKIFFLF